VLHPEGDQIDRKPDFLARDANGAPIAYVEVTTFGPSKDFVGKHKRSAAIYNGIDKAKLPAGCRLGLDIVKDGANTPSLRKLRESIERWAGSIGEINPDEPPSKRFEIDDWKMEIILVRWLPEGYRIETRNRDSDGRSKGRQGRS
jgi:hypothetical protein